MKKGLFSKLIVVFCVLEMTILQFWAMRIASYNSFLTTDLIVANHAVFGGELLLLCLKKLLCDDNSVFTKKNNNDLNIKETDNKGVEKK